MKRGLALLFVCLAIAAVATGCGGGDDSTSSSDTPTIGDTTSSGDVTGGGESTEASGGESTEASGEAPAKAAFLKDANAICKSAELKLLKDVGKFGEENGLGPEDEATNEQALELYETVVLPSFVFQQQEIAALTPPAGDEEEVGEIVDSLQAGIEEAEDDPQRLIDGENTLEDASAKAAAYGLTSCGTPSE
jgi:hypothetical protein